MESCMARWRLCSVVTRHGSSALGSWLGYLVLPAPAAAPSHAVSISPYK